MEWISSTEGAGHQQQLGRGHVLVCSFLVGEPMQVIEDRVIDKVEIDVRVVEFWGKSLQLQYESQSENNH